MGFNYLFIFPPCYVALCTSKARHRLGSESVSWCLETSLFLRLPSQDGAPSLPLFSLFLSFFSFLLSKTMGCFSGCLMSSAGIQKLFCGIYSAFKCSFDEFVGEKVVSPSYSSTILGPPSRIDWFNLLAVQGTLKSLLQHHSLKASILWCSAFCMVQLSIQTHYWKNHSFK